MSDLIGQNGALIPKIGIAEREFIARPKKMEKYSFTTILQDSAFRFFFGSKQDWWVNKSNQRSSDWGSARQES